MGVSRDGPIVHTFEAEDVSRYCKHANIRETEMCSSTLHARASEHALIYLSIHEQMKKCA